MIPISLTVGPLAAASANLFVTSVIPTSGTALTLTGSAPDKPRRVLLSYGNEGSARTLVIKGTNADGNPIQETLAVPSGGSGTVATVQDFATITSALPLGGGWSSAMTLGTSTVGSSPWKLTNANMQAVTEIAIGGVVSGTISWGIEYTYSGINTTANSIQSAVLGNAPTPPTPWTLAALTAQAGNADAVIAEPIHAWRAVILSGTGSVAVRAIESGMHS